jgi:hypothetical protein
MNVLMEDVKMAVKMYQDLISVHVHQASHRHMLGGNVKVGKHLGSYKCTCPPGFTQTYAWGNVKVGKHMCRKEDTF